MHKGLLCHLLAPLAVAGSPVAFVSAMNQRAGRSRQQPAACPGISETRVKFSGFGSAMADDSMLRDGVTAPGTVHLPNPRADCSHQVRKVPHGT